jgi:hypothetical protein
MSNRKKVLTGEGLLHFFEMHGRWGDTVYRRKRNGETEEYPYIYHPPSAESPLKLRTQVINSFANTVSNPQYTGYSSILQKLYYYTPYFITPGTYQLLAETIFYIRETDIYTFTLSGQTGINWQQKLFKRTELPMNFNTPGEYDITLSVVPRASSSGLECNPDQDGLGTQKSEDYCRRKFIVLEENADVKAAYDAYLTEFLNHILQLPETSFNPIKTYKRGLMAKTNIILGMSGTYRNQIFYQRKSCPITFLRSTYDHSTNEQTQRFKQQKAAAISAWNAEPAEFKQKWAKNFYRWYKQNYRKLNRMMTPYMWYIGRFVMR